MDKQQLEEYIKNKQWSKVYEVYRKNPVLFVQRILRNDLWEKQKEIISKLESSRKVTVKSAHGVGKSYLAARLVLWYLLTFPNSKVITTAPSFRQVEDILWRELHVAYNNASEVLGGTLLKTELDIGDEWFALGLSTDEPSRFQGFHAIDILLVVDEAAGVKENIFEASEGIISSERSKVLYIGNPTNLAGSFYKSFKDPSFEKIHISAFDTPNFTTFGITLDDIRNNTWREKITSPLPAPYLVTPEWVADKFFTWGEGTPMWDSRVMGDFPIQTENTLIPLSKIEEAVRRSITPAEDDPEGVGADVARFGSDKTIFMRRKGGWVDPNFQTYVQADTMQTTERLRIFADTYPFAQVNIDEVGVGAGVADRLKQLFGDKREVNGVNVGRQAFDPERFINLRAQLYWEIRQRFMEGTIDIPGDEELMSQLANLQYKLTSLGKIQIESKDEMKKRGLPSPDKADALVLSFLVDNKTPNVLEYMREAVAEQSQQQS